MPAMRRGTQRVASALVVINVLCVALLGCASHAQRAALKFQLEWSGNSEFASFAIADRRLTTAPISAESEHNVPRIEKRSASGEFAVVLLGGVAVVARNGARTARIEHVRCVQWHPAHDQLALLEREGQAWFAVLRDPDGRQRQRVPVAVHKPPPLDYAISWNRSGDTCAIASRSRLGVGLQENPLCIIHWQSPTPTLLPGLCAAYFIDDDRYVAWHIPEQRVLLMDRMGNRLRELDCLRYVAIAGSDPVTGALIVARPKVLTADWIMPPQELQLCRGDTGAVEQTLGDLSLRGVMEIGVRHTSAVPAGCFLSD